MNNIEEIKAKYSEPHRFYHTWDHIEYMFQIAKENGVEVTEESPLWYGILYHDIVYDPKANKGENENNSWYYFWFKLNEIYNLNQIYPEDHIYFHREYVEELILITRTHDIDFFEGNIFTADYVALKNMVDLDLASLGKPWEEYLIDRANIRKEYSHLSDKEFDAGRLEWIESMLCRKTIYYTDWGKKLEDQARKNLEFDKINIIGNQAFDRYEGQISDEIPGLEISHIQVIDSDYYTISEMFHSTPTNLLKLTRIGKQNIFVRIWKKIINWFKAWY